MESVCAARICAVLARPIIQAQKFHLQSFEVSIPPFVPFMESRNMSLEQMLLGNFSGLLIQSKGVIYARKI